MYQIGRTDNEFKNFWKRWHFSDLTVLKKIYNIMWETFMISIGASILTNIIFDVVKYFKNKSKCKIKMELGDRSCVELDNLKK